MNYELAKQLKDVGFPLKAHDEEVHGICVKCGHTNDTKVVGYYDFDYCMPTLSELIEACGKTFSELTKMTHDGETQRWAATSYSCDQCGQKEMLQGFGTTAKEAVAKLWLELNK